MISLVEIDDTLLGIIAAIVIPAGSALIGLGIKLVRLEEKVKTLQRNQIPQGINNLSREQLIEVADVMISRIEQHQGGNPIE